jgi:hypothetical protein
MACIIFLAVIVIGNTSLLQCGRFDCNYKAFLFVLHAVRGLMMFGTQNIYIKL